MSNIILTQVGTDYALQRMRGAIFKSVHKVHTKVTNLPMNMDPIARSLLF
jgi:hypothetical protein